MYVQGGSGTCRQVGMAVVEDPQAALSDNLILILLNIFRPCTDR